MSQQRRHEWRPRADFAEFAEALSVETSQIMAACPLAAGIVLVLYSPGEDETDIHRVTLKRNSEQLLRIVAPPERVPGLWDRILDDLA